jgi:hypothetical protein
MAPELSPLDPAFEPHPSTPTRIVVAQIHPPKVVIVVRDRI